MQTNELLKFYERQYGPFTHMGPADKAIWLRYLMQGGAQYAPFEYDIRVGSGTVMPPNSDPRAVSAAYALTTKRIDVVCNFGGTVQIIEVKQRAGLSAVGQLIGYRDLYRLDRPNTPPIQLWLITDQLQPDMTHILLENQIQYYETGL